MTAPLRPPATLDALHPPRTALAGRTGAGCFAWVTQKAQALDSVVGQPLAVAGEMPLLCHASATGPAARALLAAAGLTIAPRAEPYHDEASARAILRRWRDEGLKLAAIYPLPDDWVPLDAHLVHPDLLARLNSKAHLGALVPPDFCPERVALARAGIGQAMTLFPGEAVVLKVSTAIGNGAGVDVFICPDATARAAALASLAQEQRPFDGLVVERHERFATIWCAGFAILDEGVRWLGASRHLVGENGLQAGNVMGDGPPLPDAGRDAILALAARAGALGYRGLAGCDIGLTEDGRLLIFDLNFRLNASTPLLLLQGATAARSGRPVAVSAYLTSPLPEADLVRRLLPAVESGQLVPTRVLDHSLLAGGSDHRAITGFVAGDDVADCQAIAKSLQAAIA